MTTAVVFLVFMVMLFYAIHRGRDVRLSVWLLGTNASLEVTDRHTRTVESGDDHDDRTRDHVVVDTRPEPQGRYRLSVRHPP